ncbi:MAG: hypothetical protein KJ714_03380 [Euryarchaeota archaeon]|nr:hypothetical protein [Euryarchaeota archaeon]
METCKICKGDQDSKQYEEHNICTACADIIEDQMSEYFLRTLRHESNTKKGYLKYLENGKQYVSDYQRIRKHSKRHIQHMEEYVLEGMQKGIEGGKQRYLERLLQTINWLERCPEFYNYYFKKYYVCPNCGASIFEHYDKQDVGDWLMITCERCDTVIKKYFSPKFVSSLHIK